MAQAAMTWGAGHAGHREGKVTKIALTTDEHPHPPKVIFYDETKQREFGHNPSALTKKAEGGSNAAEEEEEEEEA